MLTALLFVIYLGYISLGLPDELFGSAWPVMHLEFGAPVSAAGMFTITTALFSVISSVLSRQLLRRFTTAQVTLVCIVLTSIGLFSVSLSQNFWVCCAAAVPLGLGSGCIDTALNSFVALHFESHHMNWLHCSWGIGATSGPLLMSLFLNQTDGWRVGYRVIAGIQLGIALVVLLSLPLWKAAMPSIKGKEKAKKMPLSYASIVSIKGVKTALAVFFLYVALECLTGVWGATYFVKEKGLAADTAARLTASFYMGITVGRLLCGFLSMKFSNKRLIYSGFILIGIGVTAIFTPLKTAYFSAYLLMGLGSAPLYPCLMHNTPQFFGEEATADIIGMQMSAAGLGGMLIPPLFGLAVQWISIAVLPLLILFLFALMAACVVRLYHMKTVQH